MHKPLLQKSAILNEKSMHDQHGPKNEGWSGKSMT